MQFCHFGASVWKRRTSWFLPRLTYKVYVPTLPNYCLLLPRSAAPESSEQMHTVSEAQTSVWLPPARDKYKEERKIQKAPHSPPGSLCRKSLSGLPTSSPHDSHIPAESDTAYSLKQKLFQTAPVFLQPDDPDRFPEVLFGNFQETPKHGRSGRFSIPVYDSVTSIFPSPSICIRNLH